MSDVDPVAPAPAEAERTAALPEARVRRSRWIGIVWAVPLAALILVAFLGVRALADRGIEVVVTFDNGAGARVKDTKVIYQGVEAGEVTAIEINPDGRHVDMTLRLDPRAEPVLTTETRFWLVGAKPSLGDLSSIKAALSGVTIGVAPGLSGSPARKFVGLSAPPLVMPGTPGTPYVLKADSLGTAKAGSLLFYRGQEIGRVTAVRFAAPQDFSLDVFVYAPYDRLVVPASPFWISSPVNVLLTDKGASANLEHAGSVIDGAIELGEPAGPARATSQSPAGSEFPLYASHRQADVGPTGPEVAYALRFAGPAGELGADAPIRLLGFEVGMVKSKRLVVDPDTGATWTDVRAVLYPDKLHLDPASGSSGATWRSRTDAAMNRLLATGHRARLVQSPPLIGGRVITLDTVAGARPAALGRGEVPTIPADESSGGIDEMTGHINELLAKINRIPLEEIGRDVRETTAHLNRLVSSPQLAESVQHLNSTLAQVDRMAGEVAPQVGPLVAKLNRAADEVTGTVAVARGAIGDAGGDSGIAGAIQELGDAARSIRTLADYLGRHPESLLRGRRGEPSSETAVAPAPAPVPAASPKKKDDDGTR